MTPNSIVNQNTSARYCSASAVSQRRAASPASRLTSAMPGSASRFPWPITSWTMSGSGV